MKNLFLQILDMSVSASILAAAVMLLRLLLKKAPKAIHCVLWAMVALRLLCPSLPESKVSLMPESHPVTSVVQVQPQQQAPVTNVHPPAQIPQAPVTENTVTVTQEPEKPIDWMEILSVVWLSGVAVMTLYGVGSYVFLRRKVSPAIKEDEVWLCDNVASPFILGIVRPRIYLPSDLKMEHRASVLAHEKAHLRRKDHWWKPLGFALLAVHWFNPVMWLAYILLCRDIEAACDERVVKTMEPGERKAYSEALLSCASPRRSIAACPLAFGEQGVKGRIKSVLSYKKPAVWIILVAVVASVAVGVFFLTDPTEDNALVMNMRIMWSSKYANAIEEDCFYAIASDGKFYRVYYDDMDGLRGWQLVRVTFKSESYRELGNMPLEGGYTPQYEVTAVKVVDNPTGEWCETMKIAKTLPSCVAFEKDCFYAYDMLGVLCRIYCSDMRGLYEGQEIRVTYNEKSRVNIEKPQPPGGWSPKYEVTATKVEPQQAQSEYVSTVYFIQEDVGHYWGAPNLDGAKYYAVPVTAGERDTLLKLEEGRVWNDTRLSSYLPASHMTLNVVVDDSWNFFSVNDDGYIVKGNLYAMLTQEEEALIKTLKNRAYETAEAQEYFTDDYLVYHQKTKQ